MTKKFNAGDKVIITQSSAVKGTTKYDVGKILGVNPTGSFPYYVHNYATNKDIWISEESVEPYYSIRLNNEILTQEEIDKLVQSLFQYLKSEDKMADASIIKSDTETPDYIKGYSDGIEDEKNAIYRLSHMHYSIVSKLFNLNKSTDGLSTVIDKFSGHEILDTVIKYYNYINKVRLSLENISNTYNFSYDELTMIFMSMKEEE